MVYEGKMVDPPLCESGDSRIVTGRTPKYMEKWQMWSLRWSEKPEERDRNPSSPQKKIRRTDKVSVRSPKPRWLGSIPRRRAKID